MSKRLQDLTERPADAILNFQEIREEISKEFGQAQSAEYRAALLAMLKSTLDVVETVIAAENLEKFRQIRAQEYKTFVVQEALIGENVCAEILDEVTRREIDAGRMDSTHELRKLALMSMTAPHLSRAELIEIDARKRAGGKVAVALPVGAWRRALSWLRRQVTGN